MGGWILKVDVELGGFRWWILGILGGGIGEFRIPEFCLFQYLDDRAVVVDLPKDWVGQVQSILQQKIRWNVLSLKSKFVS